MIVRQYIPGTFSPGLNAELAQMMIHVQVTPPQPIAIRHRPEEWMASPTEVFLRARQAIDQRFQLADVGSKISRLRAARL